MKKERYAKEVAAVCSAMGWTTESFAQLARIPTSDLKALLSGKNRRSGSVPCMQVLHQVDRGFELANVYVARFPWGSIVSVPVQTESVCDRKQIEVLI